MATTQTDRIEKQILLHAPRARVWRALTDAEQFGQWFRARLEGPFVAGSRTRGRITYPGYEHVVFEVAVERVQPEEFFSFRWHPCAVDMAVDYSKEPTTLVEFRLEALPEGTRLTIVESGFDRLPPGRRDESFRSNSEGWTIQLGNIQQHVSG